MYSRDFRKKVLASLETGRSIRNAASDFGISAKTISNWKQSISPKARGAERRSKISLEALKRDVEIYPDDYQHERAARFNCKQSSICNRLKKLNISKKNSPTS